jgi:hypothetical protein
LPSFLFNSIKESNGAEIQFTPQHLREWHELIGKNAEKNRLPNPTGANYFHVNNNVVYIGRNPSSPKIGDVRITMRKIAPSDVSIIAQVNNSTFEEYVAKNGQAFSRLEVGTVGSSEMINNAQVDNVASAWFGRISGVIAVIMGLMLMFRFLPALFKKIPLLGTILNAGVKLFCYVFGFVWSLLVMALAWLFYRPLAALLMLAIVAGGIWLLKKRGEKRGNKSNAAPQPESGNDSPFSYQCDKCGWIPPDPANLPENCPKCGDVFDEDDIR